MGPVLEFLPARCSLKESRRTVPSPRCPTLAGYSQCSLLPAHATSLWVWPFNVVIPFCFQSYFFCLQSRIVTSWCRWDLERDCTSEVQGFIVMFVGGGKKKKCKSISFPQLSGAIDPTNEHRGPLLRARGCGDNGSSSSNENNIWWRNQDVTLFHTWQVEFYVPLSLYLKKNFFLLPVRLQDQHFTSSGSESSPPHPLTPSEDGSCPQHVLKNIFVPMETIKSSTSIAGLGAEGFDF